MKLTSHYEAKSNPPTCMFYYIYNFSLLSVSLVLVGVRQEWLLTDDFVVPPVCGEKGSLWRVEGQVHESVMFAVGDGHWEGSLSDFHFLFDKSTD